MERPQEDSVEEPQHGEAPHDRASPLDPQRETTPAEGRGAAPPPATALPPLRSVIEVAAGGAIGAGLRYGFLLAFPQDPGRFPLTIFLENISGAFLLGMVLTLVLGSTRNAWDARPFLTTGILGSFTTFSNLSFDLVRLGSAGHAGTALLYATASAGVGLLAAGAGIGVGRFVSRRAG